MQFVLVYVLIVLIDLVKNLIMLYFYFMDMKRNKGGGTDGSDTLGGYDVFIIVLLFVDGGILTVREREIGSPQRKRMEDTSTNKRHARHMNANELLLIVFLPLQCMPPTYDVLSCSHSPSTRASSSINRSRSRNSHSN
jgi:hypothetical protein